MTGEQLDAPNQQVVREDGSAPWEEGTGGGGPVEAPPVEAPPEQPPPDAGDDEPASKAAGQKSGTSKRKG